MNVIELKKMIYTFLATISSRVFDEIVPTEINYPYIVYTLESSETDENQKMEIFDLTIDIFSNVANDNTTIDTLVGQIDGNGNITSASGLHRKHYYEKDVLRADFYRYNRETYKEDNTKIVHKQISYEVYCYLEV